MTTALYRIACAVAFVLLFSVLIAFGPILLALFMLETTSGKIALALFGVLATLALTTLGREAF